MIARRIIQKTLVIVLIFSWVLSGWPSVFDFPLDAMIENQDAVHAHVEQFVNQVRILTDSGHSLVKILKYATTCFRHSSADYILYIRETPYIPETKVE